MIYRKQSTIAAAILALFCWVLLEGKARATDYFVRLETGGHTAKVRKILFTQDGKQLISVGEDKAVRIWDVAAGRQIRTLRGFIGPDWMGKIYAAALSLDQRYLAVGGQDIPGRAVSNPGGVPTSRRGGGCDIRIFDLQTGEITHTLSGHTDAILALAFSTKGQLVSAGKDKTVWLWDANTWKGQKLYSHKAEVTDVTFSPDGLQVASASDDGKVLVWNLAAGTTDHVFDCHKRVECVAWSPDGSLLAAGADDHKVHFWDAHTGQDQPTLDHSDDAYCLAFSPDSSRLLTGSSGNPGDTHFRARIWSLPGDTVQQTFQEHTGSLYSVAWSPDAKVVASADLAGTIYLWNPADAATGQRLAGDGASVFSVAWSQDGKRVAWGYNPHDTGSWRRLQIVHGPANGASPPPDQAFDLSTGMPTPTEVPNANWQSALTETQGLTLQASQDDQAVEVLENGRLIKRLVLDDAQDVDRVSSYTFVGQDRVAIGSDFGLALYDIATGHLLKRFISHEGPVLAVALSPNGKYLASGSSDQTVRIWNIDAKPETISVEKNAVLPLVSLFAGNDGEWIAWTPQGFYYASPGGDRLVGWQENLGQNRAAVYHQTEQFSQKFRRRDVITFLLDQGDVQTAVTAANQAVEVEIKKTGQQPPPPSAQPTDEIKKEIPKAPHLELAGVDNAQQQGDRWETSKPQVIVHVRISNVTDIALVQLSLGTRMRRLTYATTRDLILGAEHDFPNLRPDEKVLPVDLRPGENVISIVARVKGAPESDPLPVTIFYNAPPIEVAAKPSLYLIAVGVQQFNDPNIAQQAPVKYTRKDAEDFANEYHKQQDRLFGKVEVTPLLDTDATHDRFLSELKHVSDEAKKGDMVIVYMASHGVRPNQSPNDTRGQLAASRDAEEEAALSRPLYFTLCDTVYEPLDQFEKTAVSEGDVFNSLAAIKPGVTVLLILDTCHSAGLDPAACNEELRAFRRHFFVLAACGPTERSYEDDEWHHGLFTKALLEALQGQPDHHIPSYRDVDRTFLELERLYTYTYDRVQYRMQVEAKTVYAGEYQSPYLGGPDGSNRFFPIAKIH